MDSSTFLTLLYISLFIIVVGHVLIKGTLGETIFRSSSTSPTSGSVGIISNMHPNKNELLDYVSTHLDDMERNKYRFNPKGSNYFSEFHDSDMHDERQDLSKYFEIEQSVPDTKALLNELQCKDDINKPCTNEIRSKITDNQTGTPLYFDQGSDGTLAYKPDIWKYENERVMNGGYIDGVRGDDYQQSSWAVYPPANQTKDENWHTSYPYTQTTGMW